MKTSRRSYLLLFSCAILSAAIAPAAQAEFKCDARPLARVDATACAHAVQGTDSLRRFVTRTQGMYGLQMKDYVRFVGDEEPKREPAPSATGTAKPLDYSRVNLPPLRGHP